MATTTWNDLIPVVSVQLVATGATVRGTLNLTNQFCGYLFVRAARVSASSPSNGIYITIRRILRDTGNNRDVPHPSPLFPWQDSTTASNLTTLNGTPSFPTAAITLTSATGFAANQLCAIMNSTSAPTRCEYQRSSKIASTTLTFDRQLANTNIVTADTITNNAVLLPPIYLDGTPSLYDLEVIFDNGAETTVAYVVEALAQSLSFIG